MARGTRIAQGVCVGLTLVAARATALWVTLAVGCTGAIGAPSGDPAAYVEEPGAVALPVQRVWRLTPLQYERAFRQAFGRTFATATDFEPDARRDGFDNIASQNHVDASWAFTVQRNAALAAEAITEELRTERSCLFEEPATEACLKAFIEAYVEPAFRRPVAAVSSEQYAVLFGAVRSDGGAAEDAITAVLESIAQSPRFLYRLEIGEPTAAGVSSLDDYSLASQLAFMMTDAPPDALLLADAEAELLTQREVVRAHAERLLQTPRGIEKVQRFFDQYLGTFALRSGLLPKSPSAFPAFDEGVQAAMIAETERFVEDLVQRDGTLVDVFSSSFTFIDETLRGFYGWEGSASPDVAFSIPAGERAGVFTHASVLAARSGSESSDALHRGLFVYEDLLCNEIAPPDGLDVNTLGNLLDSPDPEDTERQRFEFLQQNNPECAGCHGLFVPLGLALETYDAVGVYRSEQNGRTLDPSGTLSGTDNNGPFVDAPELLERIGASAKGQACFAEHWASYALGGHFEVPVSARLVAELRHGGLRVADLLVLLTQEDAFYFRRQEAP